MKVDNAQTIVSSKQIAAAGLSLISGIGFLALLLSLYVLEPEFDAPWHFISEFELGFCRQISNCMQPVYFLRRCWSDLIENVSRFMRLT